MRSLHTQISLIALFLLGALLTPVSAAVGVKGEVFSVDQLKMGDLIAFDEESPLNALSDMSPDEFMNLRAKDLQKVTGQKMSFAERMSFNMVQRQVKKQLKKAKKAASLDQVEKTDAFNFSLLWFILGILFGLITLIVSLFFGKDAILSTLLGMIIWTAVVLIFAL